MLELVQNRSRSRLIGSMSRIRRQGHLSSLMRGCAYGSTPGLPLKISRDGQRVLQALVALGGFVRHEHGDNGRILLVSCFTRDGHFSPTARLKSSQHVAASI